MNITVYLGSNPGNDPALETAVRALGAWIGGVLLYMLIIGVNSHFGTGEERENENVNPYSYRIGKK